MSDNTTKIANLIDPEVMADMISAKLPKKIRVAPFAKVDNTLQGAEGDTITVPKFAYIGDAEDVAEGVECGITTLEASSEQVKVKKAMKAVGLTDEAVLSAHGDPVGETTNQLTMSIGAKVDNDCMDALIDEEAEGRLVYDGSASKISYNGVVDAIDVFEEEVNGEKAMFINPKQTTTLRKDSNFISADKYNQEVILKGEIGMIANTRIVPTKKAKLNDAIEAEYKKTEDVAIDQTKTYYTKSGDVYTEVQSPDVANISTYYEKTRDAVAAGTYYLNPIIKLETEEETEEETPALTIYVKRDVNVETERKTLSRKTIISADEIYAVSVSNDSKLVLAKFKK